MRRLSRTCGEATIHFDFNAEDKIWSATATTTRGARTYVNPDITADLLKVVKSIERKKVIVFVDFNVHRKGITIKENCLRIKFYNPETCKKAVTLAGDRPRKVLVRTIVGELYLYREDIQDASEEAGAVKAASTKAAASSGSGCVVM